MLFAKGLNPGGPPTVKNIHSDSGMAAACKDDIVTPYNEGKYPSIVLAKPFVVK